MIGLELAFGPSTEIVIAGRRDELDEISRKIEEEYLPNAVIHKWSQGLAEKIPYIAEIKPTNDTLIYVCKGFICNLPTNSITEALKMIEKN
jgi:uncharacterized protein YyaL (SSP411 family)